MKYYLMLLLPIIAIIILIVAIRKGFSKQAFFVAAGITMVINMFAIHYVTWYGLLCTITIPFAAIYVLICLFISIKTHRNNKDEGI